MSSMSAEGVSLGYDGRRVIDGLDLAIPAGEITAIVGPNACGKSTLLRGLARLHPLEAGRVTLDGVDVSRMPRRDVARRVGVLPQSSIAPDGVRVADLVGRGRYPHQGWFGRHSSDDDVVVAEALAATGVADLADRPIEELSGGQRQRVWIAMVLAQQTDLVLLDEPTTFLDVAHQLELLGILATNYDNRTLHSREVFDYLTQLCERQKLPLFNTYIKSSVRFHEAPNERTPLILLHPELEGAKAYVEVAQEVANA